VCTVGTTFGTTKGRFHLWLGVTGWSTTKARTIWRWRSSKVIKWTRLLAIFNGDENSGHLVRRTSQAWFTAFCSWFETRESTVAQREGDLSAEYRLRNLEIPYHLVENIFAKMQKEIRNSDPEDPRVLEKIQEFRDALGKPHA
jgi:hypothetical protein